MQHGPTGARSAFPCRMCCVIRAHGPGPHPSLPFDLLARRQGSAGGAADECVRRCRRHAVLSAMPDRLAARDAIAKGIRVDFPHDAPPLAGAPTPLRLWRLARYMRGFDLVLTYNWGAFDAVMARAAVRRPAADPSRGRLQRGRGRAAEARSATATAGSACRPRTGWSCRPSGWSGSRASTGGSHGAARRIPNGMPVARFRAAARRRPRSRASSGRATRW